MYPELFGVLIRFREKPLALTGDIEKAFLQIEIAEEDLDATRLLWLKDPQDPKSEVLFIWWNRVAFGLTCSPFLLGATI